MSLVGYVNIVYACLCDILIFSESFSTVEIVGAFIILAVTLIISIYKLRESKEEIKNKLEDSLDEKHHSVAFSLKEKWDNDEDCADADKLIKKI